MSRDGPEEVRQKNAASYDDFTPVIFALLADVHSNLEALRACLAHARERGAERYAFLGDLVGYGADPSAVVDTVRSYAEVGAIVVKGNHDEALEKRTRELNEEAQEAIEYTRGALSTAQKSYLASLPLMVRDESICFVHSTADAPDKWRYILDPSAARESIEAAGSSYVFSGHVHSQVLYFKTLAGKTAAFHPLSGSRVPVRGHHRWLAIVGSVGQPRDGNPSAGYALFDSQREEMIFCRVAYDQFAAASKVRAAGLPEYLARRIENGI